MQSLETTFNALFKIKRLERFDADQALSVIGELTDLSLDMGRRDGLERAAAMGADLLERDLDPGRRATLHYFLANAWANQRALMRPEEVAAAGWQKPGIGHEIAHLRAALAPEARDTLPEERVAQILTNLGNSLSQVGRFAEAVQAWDEAREASPASPLTRGNRGLGLVWYARTLYGPAHANIVLRHAHRELATALQMPLLHDDAKSAFDRQKRWIESVVPADDLQTPLNLDAAPVGGSDEERRYAWWCLDHRLFLNPLNDLGRHSIGAGDVLALPRETVGADGASYADAYARLAAAFADARRRHYEASQAEGNATAYHLPDALAGIVEGIARLLNDYFGLEIPDDRISLSTLWHLDQQPEAGLRPPFHRSTNWPLEGLFWLSKEIADDSVGAQGLAPLRRTRCALLYTALAIHQQESMRHDHAKGHS